MTRCLSWSFLPSFEITAGGGLGLRAFGMGVSGRRTVREEYVEEAEMLRAVYILEVVVAGLAEGGPVNDPAFAGGAGAE